MIARQKYAHLQRTNIEENPENLPSSSGYFFDVILMIFNLGRAFLFAKLSLQPDSCCIKRLGSFLLFPLHYVNSNKEERVIITYLQLTIIELFDCKINDRVKLMLDLACEAFEAWHGQIFL